MDAVLRLRNQALADGFGSEANGGPCTKMAVGTVVGDDGRIYERLVDRPPPPTGTYHVNTSNEALIAKQGYDMNQPRRHKKEVAHMADMQPEAYRTGGGAQFNHLDEQSKHERLRYLTSESIVDTQEALPSEYDREGPVNYRGFTNVSDYRNITRPVPATKRNTAIRGVAPSGLSVPAHAKQSLKHARVYLPGVTDRDNWRAPAPTRGERAITVDTPAPTFQATGRTQLPRPDPRHAANPNPGMAVQPSVRAAPRKIIGTLPSSADRVGSIRAAHGATEPTRRPERASSAPLHADSSARDRTTVFKIDTLALPKRKALPATTLRSTTGDTRGITDAGARGRPARPPELTGAHNTGKDVGARGRAEKLPTMHLHADSSAAELGAAGQISERGAGRAISMRHAIENAPIEPLASGRVAGAAQAMGSGSDERLPTQSGEADFAVRTYKKTSK